MKVKIAHCGEKLTWSKKWIFLGSSFKKLSLVEKKIIGEKIKINEFLHEIFEEELENYLKWTETQRTHLNDSVHWWMNIVSTSTLSKFKLN